MDFTQSQKFEIARQLNENKEYITVDGIRYAIIKKETATIAHDLFHAVLTLFSEQGRKEALEVMNELYNA